MKIERSIIYDDHSIQALSKSYMQKKSIQILRLIFILIGIIYVVMGCVSIVKSQPNENVLALGLLMIIAALVYPLLMAKLIGHNNHQFVGKKARYILANNEITYYFEQMKKTYQWSQLSRITNDKDYLILMMNDSVSILVKKEGLTQEEISWILSHEHQKNKSK